MSTDILDPNQLDATAAAFVANYTAVKKAAADAQTALAVAQAAVTAKQATIDSLTVSYAGYAPPFDFSRDWIQDGNNGNDGGGNAKKPHGDWKPTPGTNLLTIFPAARGDNYYWYQELGTPAFFAWLRSMFAAKRNIGVRQQFSMGFPSAGDLTKSQATEAEWQIGMDDFELNGALQLVINAANSRFRPYAKAMRPERWRDDFNVPYDKKLLTPGKILYGVGYYQINPDKSVTHKGVELDGTLFPMNLTQPADFTRTKGYDEATRGKQMDSFDTGNDAKISPSYTADLWVGAPMFYAT